MVSFSPIELLIIKALFTNEGLTEDELRELAKKYYLDSASSKN